MRTHLTLPVIALLALAACSNHADSASAEASPSPAPLLSCETRQLELENADVELDANVDASLGTVRVLDAGDDASRERALAEVKRLYGEAKPDPRTTTRPWRLGLTRTTDMCGRPTATP